jgi:hypothetical protein
MKIPYGKPVPEFIPLSSMTLKQQVSPGVFVIGAAIDYNDLITPPKCLQKDLRNNTFTKFSKMICMKYLII